MCICCQLSAVKKRGKIQTGLNCEYDGLSEVVLNLTLSHSNVIIATQEKTNFMIEEEKEVLVSCIPGGP